MAKPILVANWKNYPNSLSEAKTLLGQLSRDKNIYRKTTLHIAPPLPYFESVISRAGNFANLATQDISLVPPGTNTGVVGPTIIKSFGVRLAILGHSEQRRLGETDESVSKKIKVALQAGIIPVVCIGEVTRDHEGRHFEFLRDQIKLSLAGINRRIDLTKIVIAYEPVWAVGKEAQEAIGPAELSESTIFIKKVLNDMFGRKIADHIPILYGGSVDPSNAKSLFVKTGIRGYLVGRSSLNAKSFKAIAQALTIK